MIVDNQEAFLSALHKDLHRSNFESLVADIGAVKAETLLQLKKIEEWTADENLEDASLLFGTFCRTRIRKEPLGVALIIGTWNFPMIVCLQPMLAAIAAGCCVVLKPSEVAENAQDLLLDLIPKYMDLEAIRVVTGGPKEMSHILDKKWDHIFYTGNSSVARIIQSAAAKNLTPTGKQPFPGPSPY